jgi:hypothetical protein
MPTSPKATVWLKLGADQHALLKEFMDERRHSQAAAAEILLCRALATWKKNKTSRERLVARLEGGTEE